MAQWLRGGRNRGGSRNKRDQHMKPLKKRYLVVDKNRRAMVTSRTPYPPGVSAPGSSRSILETRGWKLLSPHRSLRAQIFTKSSKLEKKTKKIIPGQMSAKCLTPSGEIPSPGQTSINTTNDCAIHTERGALVKGYDPPSGYSVHHTAGDRWRAPARHLIQNHLAAGV